MNQKALEILEYQKVLEQLAGEATSLPGKEILSRLPILEDLRDIRDAHDILEEAVEVVSLRGTPPLVGIRDLKADRRRLELGGSLGIVNLMDLADALRGVSYMVSFFKEEGPGPRLGEKISFLTPVDDLERDISRVIVSEEEISDDASPTLRGIRRAKAQKKEAVRGKLQEIVSNQSTRQYLQDALVTMREGRYVIPVKQTNKSLVRGLVHDVSASGQTVYIEPMAVVELNNELRELEQQEQQEILRILKELSDRAALYLYELNLNEEVMVELDVLFAKAKYALLTRSIRPLVEEKSALSLIGARHPLLDPKTVVPIDVHVGDDFQSLIVTGPNTGGKTVTLKTVGLLQLMVQAGLFVPCEAGTKMGMFPEIYADIGDEQSIEQSLSTFSAHMVHIVKILDAAKAGDLVLFDELGAGTDPTEGAALAMAILETMRRRGVTTMATTHYNQLKLYALSTECVANASMEFDVETLSPTYKLLIGVPGKSNAFAISERLGLSSEIIEEAEGYIADEALSFEDVLGSMEEERQRLEKSRLDQEETSRQMREKNRRLEAELRRSENEREALLEDARREARRILTQAKEEAELAVSEIRDLKRTLESSQERTLQEARDMITHNLKKSASKKKKKLIEEVERPIEEVKIGDTVYSKSLGTQGTVLELPDAKGQILVQMGIMKMKLPKNSLSVAGGQSTEEKVRKKSMAQRKARAISPELDVRGQVFDDAQVHVDKYLDDALLAGLKSVRIIHGKGTGALREKLRSYLKSAPQVKKIAEAPIEEGGSGATVVTLH